MSAIMCRGGCAAFRREQRIGYQQWNGYPDSPVSTNDFPYQCILSVDTLLVSETNLFAQPYSAGDSLQTWPAWQKYELRSGTWVLTASGENEYRLQGTWSIEQANRDVLYGKYGPTIYFNKTTTADQDAGIRNISTRITSASHLTLSTSSSWETYPDAPIAGYPYQVIFSAASYIRLIVSTAQWYYYFSGETQLKLPPWAKCIS